MQSVVWLAVCWLYNMKVQFNLADGLSRSLLLYFFVRELSQKVSRSGNGLQMEKRLAPRSALQK